MDHEGRQTCHRVASDCSRSGRDRGLQLRERGSAPADTGSTLQHSFASHLVRDRRLNGNFVSTRGKSTPSPVSSSKTTPITTTPVTAPATATTASNPWPANFTSAQQAAAKASLAAVQGYIRVEAQANAQPGAKDWTAEIRRYTADPAAYQALKAIASLTAAKVHTTGTLTQDHVAVKSADSHQVIVTACVDTSKSDLVDSAGKSVIERPKNPRTVEMFTLYLYNSKDGGWLVSEKGSVQPPRTC